MKKIKQFVRRELSNVGIVGLGLIGGSLAAALQRTGRYNVIGVDTDEAALEYAFEQSFIQLGHRDEAILRGAEVVFVCTPVDVVAETINRLYRVLGKDTLFIDVASVKGGIVSKLVKGVRYIGGHPMAGRESGGIRNASAHLFENAYFLMTADESALAVDLDRLERIVKDVGAIAKRMTAVEHDRYVSKISHLPHIAAYTLVNTSIVDAVSGEIAAGGFRDITRIASSDPAFWRNVARLNQKQLLGDLDTYIANLSAVREDIASGNWEQLMTAFESARSKRDAIDVSKTAASRYISVDVADRPDTLGKITSLLGKAGVSIANIAIENSREGVGGALTLEFREESDFARAQELLKKKRYQFSEQ